MQNDEPMPPDAVGLIQWLERHCPAPDALHMFTGMCDEPHRMDLARDLGKRLLIEELKERYKLCS